MRVVLVIERRGNLADFCILFVKHHRISEGEISTICHAILYGLSLRPAVVFDPFDGQLAAWSI